ncbi:hypothetical protein VTK73DRAFT_661 [Phialemonium thermophilum]|uniref:UBC core domain-containing protein n=1 Tax=Phialemonium thermophilum TaxID=223376 RepID=A0ABR3VUI8_9PEZI
MRALATQVAMLRTALPEGIYVRYNNADMGSLGVLFVGPKDTPYENGLFEFYMSCAGGFPKKPPAVLFKTTGGGTFRFNPNLYSNGTVCLSLLGTWGGEQWNPATSTLLQVLVSIQAMIFNEEPWYNEPGREHRVNKEESARYNDQIRAATVRLGMLDWLRTRIVSPKMRGASARRVSTARGPPSGQPIVAEGSWQGQSAPAAMATKPTNKGKDAVPIMVPGAQSQSQATALQSQPQPQPQSQQAAASLQAQAAQVLHSQDSGYPAVHDSTADPLSTAYSIPFVDAAGLGPGHFDIPLPIPGKMQVYGPSVYPSIFGQAPPRTAPGPAPPPLADDSIWGPVIRRHFAQNARAIMETVQGWSEGPGAQSKTMAHRMDELREALQEHGFLT